MKNRSILWRIAARSLVVNGIFLSIFFYSVSTFIENYLSLKFDENLENKANLLVTLVQYDDDKKGIDFDFADEFMPEFERKINPQYFHLWLESKHSFEKSHSLGEQNLYTTVQDEYGAIFYRKILPNGKVGRFIQVRFVPQIPTDSAFNEKTLHLDDMFFVVSQDIDTLNTQVIYVRWLLALCIVLVLISITCFSFLTTKRGLADLTKIVDQVKNLNTDQLTKRVQSFESSKEVYELSKQFNSMLGRIESAYNRERQFSNDVAHELKTPVTELKTIAEIELRWPDKNELKLKAEDVFNISNHMESIVTNLMALARCEHGNIYLEPEEIDLEKLLKKCIEKHSETTNRANSDFEYELKAVPRTLTSTNEVELILDNLFDNAKKYSSPSFPIKISLFEKHEQTVIKISNHTTQLQQADLSKIFDRMWQKKPERSVRNSSGLGLSLVQAYAKVLNITIKADFSDDTFTIELIFPKI